MHKMFHTEDCGLSLICRCCRGPICERRLTRADRLRGQHNLWAQGKKRHRDKLFNGLRVRVATLITASFRVVGKMRFL
jgi:IS5 family transposase